jgi:hypothetical protein|tara:strand:+ start:76 stop:378 length:303 start_codon:yes stop_codon:yes gene_type:complete
MIDMSYIIHDITERNNMKQSIEYNGKTITLPFHIPGDMLKPDITEAANHFSGETISLPRFAKAVRNEILHAELESNYPVVRKGLDWFRKHFAKEYMVLLD